MRIDELSAAGNVLLNLDKAQKTFGNLVTQLSSGLRVNTAADDPSGYAIATNLQTKSTSLAQGTNAIQEANNLLDVANGALVQITKLIDRINTLVVQANSDLNSAADLADIQTEINQLLLEINRISQNTNFNGKKLLDGSLTSTPPNNTATLVTAFNPASDGSTVPGGALIQDVQINPGAAPVSVNFTVNSYDPSTNLVTVTYTAESSDAGFGPPQTQTQTFTAGTNYPSFFPFPPPFPPYINIGGAINGQQYVAFLPNNITPSMVGQSAVFTWAPAQNYQQGSGLTVNTGDGEGSTITIQIGATDTYDLGIAGITVGDTLTNQASEALLNNALQLITTQQAQVGAQTVALGIAAVNNDTYNVNIAASASQISDLNVGQASTQYTQTQILVNVGTSVLAQMQTGERQLTALLITALVA